MSAPKPLTQTQQIDMLKQTLWGGPEGEGMVHTVAKLAISVSELTNTMRSKAEVVIDEAGEQISLRKTAEDVADIKKLLLRGLWALAGVGGGTLLIVGRSLQIAVQGHV
jgi:hypothetical protein